MRTGTIAFLCGIVAVQQLAELPPLAWSGLALFAALCLFIPPATRRHALPVFALVAGFAWASLYADGLLAKRLPAEYEGVELRLVGRVVGLPTQTERATRLDFQAEQLLQDDSSRAVEWRLRLKWYGEQPPELRPGQRWQLRVKLKRPHGFANPGGFDYEQWLFANGYSATGYVRRSATARLLGTAAGDGIDTLRQAVAGRIEAALPGAPRQGIVRALAIGDRGRMSDGDWQVLTRTGTNHLVAISGLHIGLVAGFAWWLVLRLVRFNSRLCLWRPAQDFAAVAALCVATAYAALAGFSIPTQRALIMIAVFMLAWLWRRRATSFDSLCLALLLVLLWDPMAVLAPGFWLSFTAVAVIFASLTGQLQAVTYLRQWGRLQLAISLGLLPLLVILFGRVSLVAPLANLLAIPWVSFVSVPLVFIAMLLAPFDLVWPWQLAAYSLDGLFLLLEPLANWSYASLALPVAPGWTFVPALLGVLIVFLPRGLPGRWLGLLGLVPMLVLRPAVPASGEVLVHVLDVGQGLSVVVRSHGHNLVYDSGPAFGTTDAGETVLVPFLRSQGISRLDRLVISHADQDHNGGTASLLAAVPVDTILAGQPGAVPGGAVQCRQGMSWRWDGVEFAILAPADTELASPSDNNHSCVLRISTARASLLLTGDIEAAVEHRLVAEQRAALSSDVLLAPHHGSRSSSTAAFIEAVRPAHVVYTVGYRNRYHLPNRRVVDRYDGAMAYRTDADGMLSFHLDSLSVRAQRWRRQRQRYWQGK